MRETNILRRPGYKIKWKKGLEKAWHPSSDRVSVKVNSTVSSKSCEELVMYDRFLDTFLTHTLRAFYFLIFDKFYNLSSDRENFKILHMQQ